MFNQPSTRLHARILVLLAAPALALAGQEPKQTFYSENPPPIVGEDGTLLTPTWSGLTRTTVYADGPRGALPDVAIVASASGDVTDSLFTDPQQKLMATGEFNTVTVIHAGLETPSVPDLQAFDAVLVWSNFEFEDAIELGDNLAAYVDGGGGVVVAVFADTSAESGRFISGSWETGGYALIEPQMGNTNGPAGLGAVQQPSHAAMKGVLSFDGGMLGARPESTTLLSGTLVAEWDDGKPLVAARTLQNEGRRVDLGFYPPSSDAVFFLWDSATDGDLLLANALTYAANLDPIDVELRLIPLLAPSGLDTTTDLSTLPNQFNPSICANPFVIELWASDVGELNTGLLGFYVDVSYSGAILRADNLVHGNSFPLLQEGSIDNHAGLVANFGGADFSPHGVEPEWVKIGHIEFTALVRQQAVVTSSLGLAGIAVSGRPAPPVSEIRFGGARVKPYISGDFDWDCDVDLFDFGGFQQIFGGPVGSLEGDIGDFDKNNFIDLADYAQFFEAFTGPQ